MPIPHEFLEKLFTGNYTSEEYDTFSNWVANCNREEYEAMLICWEEVTNSKQTFDSVSIQLIERIEKGITESNKKEVSATQIVGSSNGRKISLWLRLAAAAIVLAFLSVGGYFLLSKKASNQQQIAQNQIHDIAPGGNKAILTLADGKKISLTDAKNGTLANQDVVNINKTQDGQLVYNISNHQNTPIQTITYNTIETPRGGQYHLILADGTQVWLNAASSLRYPTTFTGKERKVELTGEAYFEVVHNAKSPFKVISNGQEVEDIGTHFNINAYTDEPATKTTLLEGAVRVSENNHSKILSPGQQATVSNHTLTINTVDTEEAIAWKNGQFVFENENIHSIMRKLSRWYDAEVVYSGAISNEVFVGEMSRYKNVSKVLDILQHTGKVHFKVEGKKIIVSE